ncbi:MAG: Hpt domain-containing protein [gamma proteobacterium symbiont of Bathyaustriella thionipta]|nr:Hpt domain-containing protein [gamma proteobacterium symbiont of Bathyaustriella thionipta]MCU7951177.1 Hpt domain-containing protein [gamma proteobacterium symbiont of Bathyaustriella thionipta]MCU7953986.1 Hpt domain-containing protein [gamma proteobacterium symbiont of Bathyaustriella thionipta]MCU7957687.1 Hpt domain-containing protein [gamma proteobacterium symbiont of Bathyaustriella thionipta]MCU7968781.1 Hpt domain-containing protein [gamma proteobacterium symbiont of Bathyaustriella
MTIDMNTLNELKEIMEDDFDELIAIFISDGQAQIEDLKKAIDASNSDDVRRIAHTLKGSSANLGVIDLSESCKILEYKAAEGVLEDANELLENIVSNFIETKNTLEENF